VGVAEDDLEAAATPAASARATTPIAMVSGAR
jgi:hypothetical protein